MHEFSSFDRCAAYVAARASLSAVQGLAGRWPDGLAERARRAALDTVQVTAEAITHAVGSPDRRRCLREAITSAVHVAAAVDLARAMGVTGDALLDASRSAGRCVALLGMFLHANTALAS